MGSFVQRECFMVMEVGHMGTPGNRENQLVPRSVLIDFKDCALTISADNLFQNGHP